MSRPTHPDGPSAAALPSPFHFLRHGESVNNASDRVNGVTDCALTERGREQARDAARHLRGIGISSVLTSPLVRARETAEIVAAGLGLEVRVVDGLTERNWGALENQPRAMLTDYFMVPDGGESWHDFRSRVWRALTLADVPANGLIVAHAGTARVLRHGLGIGDVTDRLPNTLPVRFRCGGDGEWRLEPVPAATP